MPPFYPDQARPYISESEAQSLFQRLDEIFLKTGSPIFPFMLIPFMWLIIAVAPSIIAFNNGNSYGWSSVIIVPILFIGCVTIIMILRTKRKREITEVIEQWNRTEGVPKGIYFALGSDNGISPDDFWLGVYPRRIRLGSHHIGSHHIGSHTGIVVTTK